MARTKASKIAKNELKKEAYSENTEKTENEETGQVENIDFQKMADLAVFMAKSDSTGVISATQAMNRFAQAMDRFFKSDSKIQELLPNLETESEADSADSVSTVETISENSESDSDSEIDEEKSNTCPFIPVSGKNKGQACGKEIETDVLACSRHLALLVKRQMKTTETKPEKTQTEKSKKEKKPETKEPKKTMKIEQGVCQFVPARGRNAGKKCGKETENEFCKTHQKAMAARSEKSGSTSDDSENSSSDSADSSSSENSAGVEIVEIVEKKLPSGDYWIVKDTNIVVKSETDHTVIGGLKYGKFAMRLSLKETKKCENMGLKMKKYLQ